MIDFDYESAMRQIHEIREIAARMTAARGQKLDAAAGCIESSWKGPTAGKFREICADLEAGVDREAARIRSLADDLESASRMIEKAEREAQMEIGVRD